MALSVPRIREFGTVTEDLLGLRNWLMEHDCPIVAMESTGVYWWPVHNVLEHYIEVILVNARHIKNVPGRKTDIADSKWLAGLLRHGLLKGSFIPPQYVRDWHDITRLRKKIQENINDYKRRIHKVFESANIKLGSMISDVFGVTGNQLMDFAGLSRQRTYVRRNRKMPPGSTEEHTHRDIPVYPGFF